MKIFLALLFLGTSINCLADLFDMDITKLCNLIDGHDLSDMKLPSSPDSASIACDYGDRNNAYEGSGYNRTFRVLRHFRYPEQAKSMFLLFDGITQKINDPKVRSEYFAIMKTLLYGITSNHKAVDNFIVAADNLKPNNSVHVSIDAMSFRVGYRVYNYNPFGFYRLDIQNTCSFPLSDTENRSQCLKKRTNMAPTIVTSDSEQ